MSRFSRFSKRLARWYALVLPLLASLCADAAIVLKEMAPLRGLVGTRVALRVSGLDTLQPHTVTVNGVAATINSISVTDVEFTVNPGATTGSVVLSEGGVPYSFPVPFRVMRVITGTFVPSAGVNPQGYQVVAGNMFSAVTNLSQFKALVPLSEPAVIWAVRGEFDPAFLAVVAPSDSTITINAFSTAQSWGFMSPYVGSPDTARALAALTQLAALPETAALANWISTIVPGGMDYADDPRFLDAQAQQVAAFVGGMARLSAVAKAAKTPSIRGGFQPGTPAGTALYVLNPHESQSPTLVPPARVEAKILGSTNAASGAYPISFETGPDGNRLDWFVELFRLDPAQFPLGTNSIMDLDPADRPAKLSRQPLGTAVVKASLETKKLKVLDLAVRAAVDSLTKSIPDVLKANRILVAKDSPGIYLAQAYSGNLFYGTKLLLVRNANQSDLIDMVGADEQWVRMLAANLVIAATDALSGSLEDSTNITRVTKIAWEVTSDVMKALAPRGAGGKNSLTLNTVFDATKAAIVGLARGLLETALEEGPELLIGHEDLHSLSSPGLLGRARAFVGRALHYAGRSIEQLTKISLVLQSLERSSAVFDTHALAMERMIIVVGEPFTPLLRSFHPQRGRGNDTLVLEGHNFPTNASLLVSFCTFTSTTNPTVPSVKLPLLILSRTLTSIAVSVPANFAQVFPDRRAYLCVENVDTGTTFTSLKLSPPYREFEFIPPPMLFSVYPDPVRPGGNISISGSNFFGLAAENHRVVFDGVTEVMPDLATDNTLNVKTPASLTDGGHTLAVKLNGLTSPTLGFMVQKPPTPSPGSPALGIVVTVMDFSNAADGQISLLEAFLLASGGTGVGPGKLGRSIEVHLPCESLPISDPMHCPFVTREIDSVSGADTDTGAGGGPGSIDFISLAPGLQNTTIILPGLLPAPTSGDTYNLQCTLDGNGDVVSGWLLDGVRGVTLNNAVLRNFGAHGIHLRNGARDNFINNVRIENVGGNGVFLDEHALNNDFFGLRVSGAGRNALYLSGAEVTGNAFELQATGTPNILGLLERAQQNGLRIDRGAKFNRIEPGTVRSNSAAGILITGADTGFNLIGRQEFSLPRYYDIYYNGGPGIHLTGETKFNVIRYVNPAGNNGDGVLLEGPNCAFNQLDSVNTGVDYYYQGGPPVRLANQGSGIHLRNGAHDNLIGSRIPGAFGGRGFICGDRDDGILLEGAGTSNNVINRKHIGTIFNAPANTFIPVGRHGIHLMDGAHHNVIGDTHQFLDVHIYAVTNGSGILIEGTGTDFNEVIGNQIGANHNSILPPAAYNAIGVHIKDGAMANVIGAPGAAFSAVNEGNTDEFRFGNSIGNCTEAGVVLDNCGGLAGLNGTLLFPNLVQNNLIGEQDFGAAAPCGTGIQIINNAVANVIGGELPTLGNTIINNHTAGIWINNVSRPALVPPNRILNNDILKSGTLIPLPGPPAETAQNPGQYGVGVLVTESSGNRIGETLADPNLIQNNRIGVYLANSVANRVIGNFITDNSKAGVIIRGGEANVLGGLGAGDGNSILRNGANGPTDRGVGLILTMNNQVVHNLIGLGGGNRGPGLVLDDASANEIGSDFLPLANLIGDNASHGIVLTGALSRNNRIVSNHIGQDGSGLPAANVGDGVRLENGAAANAIGSDAGLLLPPLANVIANNTGAGVFVSGNATTGNSILFNSITANAALGIDNVLLGNFELPPPLLASFDGGVAEGKVTDLALVPPGSRIQVFSDADNVVPEGARYLGEGFVQSDGTWRANLNVLPVPPNLTVAMTATHAVNGSTSQFGTGTTTNLATGAFRIDQTDTRPADFAPAGAARLPVLKLTGRAKNASVRVTGMSFSTSGSLNESNHVVSAELFEDIDGNGVVTGADRRLGGPVSFTADNGTLAFANLDEVVEDGESKRWLVVYTLSAGAPPGTTFAVQLPTSGDVQVGFKRSAGVPLQAQGPFPIASATYTVTTPSQVTLAQWKQSVFTPAQLADSNISGDNADPDGDGVINLLEYAFNMNPLLGDRDANTELGSGIPRPKIVNLFDPVSGSLQDYFAITYVRRKPPADVAYRVEHSLDLFSWVSEGEDPFLFETVLQSDIGQGNLFELITVRSTHSVTEASSDPLQFLLLNVQPTR